MQTYLCLCGQTLFFDSRTCVKCGRTAGWCDGCQRLTVQNDFGQCSYGDCAVNLTLCADRVAYDVCNGFVAHAQGTGARLCGSCLMTTHVPDVSNLAAVAQWARLESAKRRLLYDLRSVGYSTERLLEEPPLRFRFLADTPAEHVVTGHADGIITINLSEADPVEREISRQKFHEPQRTMIGHFRHEIGHFIWMRDVESTPRRAENNALFGDPLQPPYADAMQTYYEQGPPSDWQERFISAYAASHPWEDFAESVGFYLDIRAVLDTLSWQIPQLASRLSSELPAMLATYQRAGVALNEINRTMGLSDLVPEVVPPRVLAKLQFIHDVITSENSVAAADATAPESLAR